MRSPSILSWQHNNLQYFAIGDVEADDLDVLRELIEQQIQVREGRSHFAAALSRPAAKVVSTFVCVECITIRLTYYLLSYIITRLLCLIMNLYCKKGYLP